MLRLVLKKDDQIKIGEDIMIRSMNEGRVSLAVDAPKELRIDRIEVPSQEVRNTNSAKPGANGRKKYVIVNNKE